MIDTLKAKEAGFTNEQIEVLRDKDRELVTRDYLDAKLSAFKDYLDTKFVTKDHLDAKLAPLDIQIKIAIAIGIALFIKSFF